MSSMFSIALSGLKAQSQAINTTGNNLANMNTDGFKQSAVNFKDLFSEFLGVSSGFQTGLGVSPPISTQLFTQGPIQSSLSPLAAAVQGDGFFLVQSPADQQLFTRDGNFLLDETGVLKTQTGERVQGWMASAGGTINTSGVPGDIALPSGAILPPVATQSFSMNANLDASTAIGSTYSQPLTVVDSLGNTHDLTLNFKKTAINTWTYDVTIPGDDLTTGTPGTQVSLLAAPGTVTFKTDGTIDPALTTGGTTPATATATGLADGAASLTMSWNLFDANGNGTLTQYGQPSSVGGSKQDGTQAAQLTSVSIQNGGQIVATFSNGQKRVEAQLALASIQNPTSLQNAGNNNFAATSDTANPAIGMPQTADRGQILGGALEGSNVDMATEFTNLIVYQSAYQANSRVISTADQMNQDLFNVIH
ncbi:MAG TPA: flagellar hook protein FlgE [Bryobacteraceae bacterium]|jgi:flagellar hook protein FlgE